MKYCFQILTICGFSSVLLISCVAVSDWQTLLDGESGLDNFIQVGEANWTATGGAIQATEGAGTAFLMTPQSYDDFELRVEFWASDDANSGIFLRCQEPGNINDRNCYEANIFDQRPDTTYATGGIVHLAPVPQPRPLAGGRWNTYEITLQGPRLLVVLNGETTVDIEDSQFTSGPFALQWGSGTMRFRKVEVRRL